MSHTCCCGHDWADHCHGLDAYGRDVGSGCQVAGCDCDFYFDGAEEDTE